MSKLSSKHIKAVINCTREYSESHGDAILFFYIRYETEDGEKNNWIPETDINPRTLNSAMFMALYNKMVVDHALLKPDNPISKDIYDADTHTLDCKKFAEILTEYGDDYINYEPDLSQNDKKMRKEMEQMQIDVGSNSKSKNKNKNDKNDKPMDCSDLIGKLNDNTLNSNSNDSKTPTTLTIDQITSDRKGFSMNDVISASDITGNSDSSESKQKSKQKNKENNRKWIRVLYKKRKDGFEVIELIITIKINDESIVLLESVMINVKYSDLYSKTKGALMPSIIMNIIKKADRRFQVGNVIILKRRINTKKQNLTTRVVEAFFLLRKDNNDDIIKKETMNITWFWKHPKMFKTS